jgi:two-component system, chemotaxis family, response regulator Rcp1
LGPAGQHAEHLGGQTEGRPSQGPEVVPSKPLEILVIENNPADARLTVEAFKEAGLHKGILQLPDGDQALAYLRRQGEYAKSSLPHIIFLDLHLPRKPGLVVLAEIKENPVLKVIPVVVISGSHDPNEVRKAYELHASCFIYKPSELDQFLWFIRSCYEFWGTVVTLPQTDS